MPDHDYRDALLRSEDRQLAEKIRLRQAQIAVVGLGFVGTETLRVLARAGYSVAGYDISADALNRCRDALAPEFDSLSLGLDERVVASSDVVFIAIRLQSSADLQTDLTPLRNLAGLILRYTGRPRLIMIQTTVPPGATRKFATEWLSAAAADGLMVAHCPERLQAGNNEWNLVTIPRLVGGVGDRATILAKTMLSQICNEVIEVSAPEISELSKLLENAFIATGVGLIGELTRLAHSLGVEATRVCDAASSKPYGYYSFQPGPGVGGHCVPNDLQLLNETMRSAGLKSRMLDGVTDSLSRMPATVVERVRELSGDAQARRVVLIGVGFKIGSSDTSAAPARDIVRRFRQEGAEVFYLDSRVPDLVVDDCPVTRLSFEQIRENEIDACVIVSGDPGVSINTLCQVAVPVLDAGGASIMPGEDIRMHRL